MIDDRNLEDRLRRTLGYVASLPLGELDTAWQSAPTGRATRLHALWPRVAIVLTSIAIAAAAVVARVETSQRPPVVGASAPTLEIYAIPKSGPTDWQMFSQSIGPDPSTEHLASGISASVVPNTDAGRDFAIYPHGSSPVVYSFTQSRAPSRLSSPTGAESVLLASGPDIFYQSADRVIELDTSSQSVVHAYRLPSLPNDSVAGVPPPGFKGFVAASSVGTVDALLQISGNLFALQSTLLGAAVVNLSTGAVTRLPGYGALGGGAVGADGDIYTVAWRPNDATCPMHVLQIIPSTLQIGSASSTRLSCAINDNVQVFGSSTDNALIYVTLGADGSESSLWSASGGKVRQLRTLPNDVGLYASEFGQGMYFYGGSAANRVSILSLSNLSLTQNAEGYGTPAGSDVLAIG